MPDDLLPDSTRPQRFEDRGDGPSAEPSDEPPVESDPSIVYDRAALEQAERAARVADSADDAHAAYVPAAAGTDEQWTRVATVSSMDSGRSLEPIYEALCEAGIPAGFDPYRPGVAASPYPFMQRAFHVVVPASRLDEARSTLAEMGVDIPGTHSDGVDRGSPTSGEGTGSAELHADQVGPPNGRSTKMSRSRKTVLIVVVLLLVATAAQLLTSLLFELGVLR